jgi:hypothetical protein
MRAVTPSAVVLLLALAADANASPAWTPWSPVPDADTAADGPVLRKPDTTTEEANAPPPPPAGELPQRIAAPLETSKDLIEASVEAVIHRIDRFFGDPTHRAFEEPSTRFRVRNDARFTDEGEFADTLSFVADLRVPALDAALARASIFLAGQSRDDERDDPDDPVRPRLAPSLRRAGGAVELRYDLWRSKRGGVVDVGAGFRFRLPPPPYLRARLGQRGRLGPVIGHFTQTGFWERREGFGETTRLDLEAPLGDLTVPRFLAVATIHQESRGLEWLLEAGVQRTLGARTGAWVAASMDGKTAAPVGVERYRAYARLRRELHRRWVYGELEPEILWPADDAGRRERVLALTLRLELQFQAGG